MKYTSKGYIAYQKWATEEIPFNWLKKYWVSILPFCICILYLIIWTRALYVTAYDTNMKDVKYFSDAQENLIYWNLKSQR